MQTLTFFQNTGKAPTGFEVNALFAEQVLAISTVGTTTLFEMVPVGTNNLTGTNPLGGNTMVAFYTDQTGTFQTASNASSVTSAFTDIQTGYNGTTSNGSLYLSFGPTADTQGAWGSSWYWVASGPANPLSVSSVTTNFDFTLPILLNNTGMTFLPERFRRPARFYVDQFGVTAAALGSITNDIATNGGVIVNTGTNYGQTSNTTTFPLYSDDPTLLEPVPEPSALVALLGGGLSLCLPRLWRGKRVS